jgi:hypothetical protein
MFSALIDLFLWFFEKIDDGMEIFGEALFQAVIWLHSQITEAIKIAALSAVMVCVYVIATIAGLAAMCIILKLAFSGA